MNAPDNLAEVMKACRVLQADLDAAQDEIERRIEASERDRELIRQLGTVVEHMAPAAYRAIVGGVS